MSVQPLRLVAGCMTGTSIDSLDAALVEVTGIGLAMRARFLRGLTRPLGPLAPRLRALAEQQPAAAGEIAGLSRELSLLHAAALRDLVADDQLHLAAVHGQTLFHAPPVSWQMISPAPIAGAIGAPVVFDLRAADLDAGGQGAPITPLADWVLFRHLGGAAIVNLGGFCNVTLLPATGDTARVGGGDVCPCNHLLDGIARELLGVPFDEGGRVAMTGQPDPAALEDLARSLASMGAPRRSLGTGDETTEWVRRWRSRLSPGALGATACRAIAGAIARATSGTPRLLLAGGGTRNRALVGAIESQCAAALVEPIEAHSLPSEYREAVCMAVLGALCQDGVPITLPRITGVPEPAPVSGLWAFPRAPARKPSPQPASPPPAASVRVSNPPPPNRSHLLTEQRHPRSTSLHTLSVAECVAMIHEIDLDIAAAMDAGRPSLIAFIEAVEPRFNGGGRLVYLGAGTSGRLGVLDASEAPPTFQIEPGRIIGLIAGGDPALRRSSEGREDDRSGADDDLNSLELTSNDAVLGIAAGGTTPYVLGALEYCKNRPPGLRPLTALLAGTPVARPTAADHLIVLPTGPEVLTGSTRMKAGTATKLALNTISTTLMVRSGRVYENLMVDLRATNDKLRDRAIRIVSTLTGLSREDSLALLLRAGGAVKTAIVMHAGNTDLAEAERRLAACGGRLARVIQPGGS